MSQTILIVLIIVILLALVGAFLRRREKTAGRKSILWLIGIFGVIAIVVAVLALFGT